MGTYTDRFDTTTQPEPQEPTDEGLLKLEADELLYDLIDQAYDLADQELEMYT
jgi:hypothetical protein